MKKAISLCIPVSYTHLDVYKRQTVTYIYLEDNYSNMIERTIFLDNSSSSDI